MVKIIENRSYLLRLSILALMLIAVVIAGYMLNQERKQAIVRNSEILQLRTDLENLDLILANVKEHEKTISEITLTVPKSYEEVADAIAQFEEAARQNSLDLSILIKDNAHPEENGLSSVEVVLEASGSYDDFAQMMSDISLLPYHTHPDALSIDRPESQLVSKATLRVYIQEN